MEKSSPVVHFRGVKKWCIAFAALACSCSSVPPPSTAPSVDLSRYAGDWYEIESFPNMFQRGCSGTKAHYEAMPDGRIKVRNTCERNGRKTEIEGTARVVPRSHNAKLKVSFFWPIEGDYWILEVAPDYRWAAVGTPGRDFLWILSRTPQLDGATLEQIRARLAALGYDISRLKKTPQAESPAPKQN